MTPRRSASCSTTRNELAVKRREDPRDDIVTKLINADVDGEALTELEFDMFMLLLSVAGNETTRTATGHRDATRCSITPSRWPRCRPTSPTTTS